jgi:ABC-type transport system substrate-binding protein
MPPRPARAVPHRRIAPLALALLLVATAGCSTSGPERTTHIWLAGQAEPPFDPTGPADPVRAALERLVGEGLVAEDTTGRIAEAAARRWDVTPDGLTYTFHLRPGLRFASGRECTSSDFRLALESGLNRVDHGTLAWLLSPIAGVDRVRAGRPLPPLGIATPDAHTLVLKLVRADPTLLHKLALAGVSSAWEPGAGNGGWEGGTGPYRIVSREPGRRWILARRCREVPTASASSFRSETAGRGPSCASRAPTWCGRFRPECWSRRCPPATSRRCGRRARPGGCG